MPLLAQQHGLGQIEWDLNEISIIALIVNWLH
jgi:hypothetical protein